MNITSMKLAKLLLLPLFFVSCASQPSTLSTFHFNGATETTTKDSNTEIMSHLSNSGKAEYLAALVRIQSYELEQRKKQDPNAKVGPLGEKINGMTYQEIMQYSKQFPDNVTIIRH
jgi:hypothetical protein